MKTLKEINLQELSQAELSIIDGGTEIGYWLGYYGTKVVEAFASVELTINTSNGGAGWAPIKY